MTGVTPQELTKLKFKFYGALVCDQKLSGLELRVAWLLLTRYLNAKSLVAWPSKETLARDLGSSSSPVRRALKRLVERKWFKIEHKGGGRRHANVYSACLERGTKTTPFKSDTMDEAETGTETTAKGDQTDRERGTKLTPNILLREPFEEPLEGGGARAEKPGQTVHGFSTDQQKDARQGDPGGGAGGSQDHFMLPIQGGNQPPRKQASAPDWNGWAGWLQTNQGMTKDAAWSWLMATLERIETERGVESTEAGAILDRELKRRRKAAA
ncbi:MAG: helix-turn-helix domain-containing protein [Proteobacteria bacterium]|nr:helix-turn-helix domain-containing protein [Pseudomonadota bacterium]